MPEQKRAPGKAWDAGMEVEQEAAQERGANAGKKVEGN